MPVLTYARDLADDAGRYRQRGGSGEVRMDGSGLAGVTLKPASDAFVESACEVRELHRHDSRWRALELHDLAVATAQQPGGESLPDGSASTVPPSSRHASLAHGPRPRAQQRALLGLWWGTK